ncbi:AraC family transcriptional regulator [Methylobacterium sp. WL30]|uniref:AraC family transcriptional regulator n=1 Tax=unclassified Methylobacterium TaxID=2615210 RepID=UPI0011C8F424|nr:MULTISPECIES: AraC family transcriptional regulator [unclassified Methylobacterium]TXN40180.1 AraC family transcriptional regulator [Methylobacterium sp. WL93]TXN49005.1 AraC family transcriptional regulator [Methylobacterium sp. WL119]TXN66404.1 AraC family transcriptional regulator [Methylobacterium sp. WL30]
MTTLLAAVRRHAEDRHDAAGIAATPIPGLSTVWAGAPSGLHHDISRPLVCLVLQGSKHVTMGTRDIAFGAGDSLLITADVPTVSQITRASGAAPYLSLVLELDPAVIAALTTQMPVETQVDHLPVRVDPTDAETADAALRLMQLLDRPASIPVLGVQLVREMHYWLLAGRHGAAIRSLGWPDGRVERITRAVALLRSEFARHLPVERLAATAGMSTSSFHQHFRTVTSLSPLQFQKHLRLIEARRLLVSEGMSSSAAAFTVGYESVTQFTREYGRMFGVSPVRDAKAVRCPAAAPAA